MEIFGFLLGLGCLVLIAWAITILGGLVFGRKRRQQNRHQQPPSLTPPEIQERNLSQPTITAPPPPSALPRRVVTFRQPPVSTRVRFPSRRHQHYIRLAALVMERLRDAYGGSRSDHHSTVVQLLEAIQILRF